MATAMETFKGIFGIAKTADVAATQSETRGLLAKAAVKVSASAHLGSTADGATASATLGPKGSILAHAAAAATSAVEKAKVAVGAEPSKPPTLIDEINQYTTISRKSRFVGFALLFGLGCVFSALSTLGIPLIIVNPSKFAVPYTMGSICSIGSTMCLVGPSKQLSNMFSESRRISTLAYLASVFLTLIFAFNGQAILCLVCIVVQLSAMVW